MQEETKGSPSYLEDNTFISDNSQDHKLSMQLDSSSCLKQENTDFMTSATADQLKTNKTDEEESHTTLTKPSMTNEKITEVYYINSFLFSYFK